ncbi:DUF2894 domain-containing protein [Dechloromonas sp. A34]|uniref:DUF2894 domain-containing protein n=1 Tax=Dechloromonas sp. A34 TaxID=447588 RepID=UPI002248B796|nr:DUF2894 domain-containing protein [Dechloromonas sp. A34]
MRKSRPAGAPKAAPLPDIAPDAMIDALRARGANRFDPVRFRFIEALARRAATQPASVKHILEGKLAKLLLDYSARLELARNQAGDALAHSTGQFPAAADDLRQHHEAGDLGGLQRLIARLEAQGRSPLAELLAHIGQHPPEVPFDGSAIAPRAAIEPPGELKALSYFRSTWSQLSVDQQLTQALAQVPDNAGPLNSHRLALQSLKLMRDVSPDYLKRFMSYVDALFWLDQTEIVRNPGQKNATDGDKKRKSTRRNAG